jgi:hypothetical protein
LKTNDDKVIKSDLSPTDYHRLIVSIFCDFNSSNYGGLLNEAVKVYKQYPDPDFWDWLFVNCSTYKVTSPRDFLSGEGTEFMLLKRGLWKSQQLPEPKKVEHNLESDTLGKDRECQPRKPKTLFDFIKGK